MDVFSAIHGRRSIRKYTEAPVAASDVRDILAAAMSAPSAGNAQPWRCLLYTSQPAGRRPAAYV